MPMPVPTLKAEFEPAVKAMLEPLAPVVIDSIVRYC